MRNFLTYFKILLLAIVLLLVPAHNHASAEQSFGLFYVSITDAIMSTQNDDDVKAVEAIEDFQKEWQQLSVTEGEESQAVTNSLEKALVATTSEERLTALTGLSKALTAYEKAENPVDEKAGREDFLQATEPFVVDLKTAVDSGNTQEIQDAYSVFLGVWSKNERVVQEQSIAAYGQVETQMSFMRISLAEDSLDVAAFSEQVEALDQTIQNFAAGKIKESTATTTYSLATLIGLLEKSEASIEEKEFDQAAEALKKFITIWPSVEGEIRTKNAGLYSEIEAELPLLVSDLTRDEVQVSAVVEKIASLKQQINFIQQDTEYSFWDSALILLREGLEALLIISALIAFLKKAGQQHMQHYVYIGAAAGIAVSILAAVLMSTLLQSGTIDASREVMEGYIGLLAAAMMLGVGVWLHSKSTVTAWNQYIAKQMNQALSTQSVLAMTVLSFLTVFREGAETVVFYMGIAPKMSTFDFSLGIVLALLILVAAAFFFAKASKKIPMHLFFGVATVFIYLLAFKIIGASIHTLQLTNVLPTHILADLPVINVIGFYPSVETLSGQLILVILIVATILYKKNAAKTSNVAVEG
ncbi:MULTISPECIES: FTR1 family protein [Planococcus]|uniref:Transporter n=1 Tax=Planococcus faecalis TaxID=1598147 RepID=A0ABN4XNZ0_9BACL|nr:MULTISPECIES: FTR1 family protein [Planococcus]AQU78509.1 transporter [Planococcus faecalis]MDJ0331527.1 FTR1 family protein [Planococcus sp. S3-L1]